MRAELRELRKSHPDHAPVSKMKKGDVSELIQKLKAGREETPSVASVTNAPVKMQRSAVESVKEAKASEFPLEVHSDKAKAKAPKAKAMEKEMAKAPKAKAPKAKAEPMAEVKAGRPAKGSEEMKARMAKMRAMKKKE